MATPSVKWSDIRVLTFDCYGTLIDWERGILETLMLVLHAHDVRISEANILDLYAVLERGAESEPYRDYKSVLRLVMDGLATKFQFQLAAGERDCLVESLKLWRPFPDTIDALKILKRRFSLAVISNIDDDLFLFTQQRIGIPFDWVITAEHVKSYKPSLNNFHTAFQRIGVPTNQIVHVAQSMYHDIAPANRLGLSCVWVNRRQDQLEQDATTSGAAIPDIEVPDLQSLVKLMNS